MILSRALRRTLRKRNPIRNWEMLTTPFPGHQHMVWQLELGAGFAQIESIHFLQNACSSVEDKLVHGCLFGARGLILKSMVGSKHQRSAYRLASTISPPNAVLSASSSQSLLEQEA